MGFSASLSDMGELQMVLKYEIEAAGAKESDAPLKSIVPDTEISESESGSAPTLKLMKAPASEKSSEPEQSQSSWGSSFSAQTLPEPPTKQVKLYQYPPHRNSKQTRLVSATP